MNTSTSTPRRGRWGRAAVAVAALSLVAAACGGDDDDDAEPEASADEPAASTAEEPADDTGEMTEDSGEMTEDSGEMTEDSGEMTDGAGDATATLDTNGDGVVQFGVATPGPRDDGAYYQALVEGVIAFAEAEGLEDPIIVDNIDPAQAETEIRNLARQGVDAIAIGAGELSDPLETLAAEFPEIFWYCNCGAGQQYAGIAQSSDDSSEISYSAGYATGLLLADTESTSAAFLGCCDLDFEKEAFLAFQMGLMAVDPAYTATYIPTGDFNDVAGATEAFNQATANGAGAVYPFLGGAHEAVVGLANENDIITMSAGASDACERDDLDYQIAVQFDGGDYLEVIFDKILSGELQEDETFLFNVGAFDFVGAKLCDATPEQEAALADAKAQIANGDFAEDFFAIKSEAYGF